jgi:DNA ligase-1
MKKFAPILAPNEEIDLSTLKYPLLASKKLDGIRCLIYKGQILSRSLKQIQNKQLRARLESLRLFSEKMDLIFDGEIYSPYLTFQQITHFVMTQDLGNEKLPEHIKFYCFDLIDNGMLTDCYFEARLDQAHEYIKKFSFAETVKHHVVNNEEEVNKLFEFALNDMCDGLILRDPKGKYKFGRGTVKEGLIYKVKPFRTFDSKIKGVIQATKVRKDAKKTINELGRSVTSKKKNDRVLIEKASAFSVEYEGKPLKVVLACSDKEKEAIWASKEKYIGKWIEYKGMLVGAKDVPRHPVFLRFRIDKD